MFLISMKQRLLTIALNIILIFVDCPYWTSQGKVREFNVVWKVVTMSYFDHLFIISGIHS